MTNQLSLFSTPPLPLLVADKWDFKLAYVDKDGDPDNYIYCARDWYIGLGGTKDNWSHQKTDWLYPLQPVDVDVKRPHRPVEKLEFVNAEGLYSIVTHMQVKDVPQLEAIKGYLAKAGVKIDQQRRAATDPKVKKFQRMGKDDKWIGDRLGGIVTRNEFTDALARVCSNINYGQATDAEYKGVFGRTAKDIRKETGAKNARDAMTRPALHLLGAVEATVTAMLGDRQSMSADEAMYIINEVALIHRPIAHQLQMLLNIDLATGKPLLTGGVR